MDSQRAELRVSFDLGGPSFTGAVGRENGGEQPFTGWLQFVTAIEQAVQDAQPHPATEELP